MIRHIHNKVRKVYQNIASRNNITGRKRKSAIIHFSEKVGLVYFGTVDQHHDDHHIVRGLTASTSHLDEHYAVGTFEDYDVSLVHRIDTTEDTAGKLRTHAWVIFEIKLKHNVDIPHIFMGAHEHKNSPYAKLFSTHTAMQRVPLGTFERYDQEFTSRYSLFARALYFIQVERYFTAAITKVIAAHFWPLSVEVCDGLLYIYADNQPITIRLLETMLKNGLWLAKQLDEQLVEVN